MTKEFKNGNINIKIDSDDMNEFKNDQYYILSELLFWVDSYIVGEPFCLGNDCGAVYVYNVRRDCIYILSDYDIYQKLINGKTAKLYACKPDADQREMLTAAGF